MSTPGSRLLAIVPALLLLTVTPAQAQTVTNPGSLHALARSGGKTCMVEHEHYGEGIMPSRAGAEAAARRAWVDSTAFEYGRAWASYAAAAGARMSCAQSGGLWSCKTTARPCRR